PSAQRPAPSALRPAPAPSALRPASLVAERFDGVQARRLDGGEEAEEDADTGREADADRKGPPGQRNRELRDPVDREADAAAEEDPEQAAERRQHGRLDEELPEDLAAACAKGLADADLARAFGHRDHHDRHDADAADHQRDR